MARSRESELGNKCSEGLTIGRKLQTEYKACMISLGQPAYNFNIIFITWIIAKLQSAAKIP